jgi:hypothetical protein
MNSLIEKLVLQCTKATAITSTEVIQSLWSGYGEILRVYLDGADVASVIVKHISPPNQANHPRGWNTDIGHQRKLKSYDVEMNWYREFNSYSSDKNKFPTCLYVDQGAEQSILILEDLKDSGFPNLGHGNDMDQIEACIKWLANFHSQFVNIKTDHKLWPIGTYWHLDTRPDELIALEDQALKDAAWAIDETLNNAKYQTLVHGDAKVANFCFSTNYTQVSAVDFQYIGNGIGVKDLAYFIGSCLNDNDSKLLESKLLELYFTELKSALISKDFPLNQIEELTQEWSELYYFAWADFHRFLKGWSPGHWKINGYSETIIKKVLAQL